MGQEKSDARLELEAAGWESEDREGEALWRNPENCNWYEEKRAMEILKGDGTAGVID